jgi:excisionase family DNA binding protein
MKAEFEEMLSEPTISVPDAGRILGLARNGAYEAVKRGDIPVVRLGHKIRVPTALLKKMIE